jgi:CpeT/CpcT family (DUF1001)
MANNFKTLTLTVLFSVLAFAPKSRAATLEQVKQAAQWFTGSFNNAEQVANNPLVPVISMSNCAVQLDNANPLDETQNIYLEQKSSAFGRVRFYSFGKSDSAVNLSIRSFANNDVLNGICARTEGDRIVNFSNLIPASCNLQLVSGFNRYTGTNAPGGCPTSTGGKVVSQVAITENTIDSLDQIFDNKGILLVNTPIEFQRIRLIPEPSIIFGILAFSAFSLHLARKNAI